MNEMVQPLGPRVLVRVLEEESVPSSGLVVPETAKEKPQRGSVVAVGDVEDVVTVEPGDRVLYPKYSGTEVVIDGAEHLILEAADPLNERRQSSDSGAQQLRRRLRSESAAWPALRPSLGCVSRVDKAEETCVAP